MQLSQAQPGQRVYMVVATEEKPVLHRVYGHVGQFLDGERELFIIFDNPTMQVMVLNEQSAPYVGLVSLASMN